MLILLASCNTFKKIISFKNNKTLNYQQIQDSLKNSYLQYNTLFYKFNADIKTKSKNFSFAGNIKIRKDSAILIAVTPLGFEIGRALFTKDSIIVINKIQSQYFADDYDYFLLKYNVFSNYNVLQSVITDNLFYYSKDTTNMILENLEKRDSVYILKQQYKNDKKTIIQQTELDANNYNVNSILLLQADDLKEVNIKYSDFQTITDKRFPNKIDIVFKDTKNNYEVNFVISKILIDNKLKFNLEIPKNYAKIWF